MENRMKNTSPEMLSFRVTIAFCDYQFGEKPVKVTNTIIFFLLEKQ